MAAETQQSIREVLAWAGEALARAGLHYGHGTDNPDDEAAWLVAHALGLRADQPLPADISLGPTEQSTIRELIEKRIETRIPAAYLTGRAWFAGMELYVDQRVLIPRSPLAEAIRARFGDLLSGVRVERLLDLCTGSGCIALACARAFPDAQVDASDLSPEALQVAAINVAEQGLQQRVGLYRSDLFDDLPPRRYQLIVSNPPYVGDAEMAQLPAEYRHEPDLALRAADDGLALVSRMLFDAPRFLTEDGVLVVEVGNSADLVDACYPDLSLSWLEFSQGGEGVFAVKAQDLRAWVDLQS